MSFQPGSIVKAREREWIVLPDSSDKILHLRPIGGSEIESTFLHIDLEKQPLTQAVFPIPKNDDVGPSYATFLFKDAILLKMRSGAGPFRSFGNITFTPRAYQLVPLMMAMKHDTVRILIADDVGIGKTIESGLIVRELYDRGEIDSFTVLVPPHLCEQWQEELKYHFQFEAVVVKPNTVAKLERFLPPGKSIFEVYPFTIVSLDYIKADRRRDEFLRSCSNCVIVDEAHTCTQGYSQIRHKRFSLLKDLSLRTDRHMIFLTATPHSGDDEAFYNLLGLLNPEFKRLIDATGEERENLRKKLSEHFVQRRRPDIDEWQDQSIFPKKFESEVTYKLTDEWIKLFDEVMEYANELIISSQNKSQFQQRLTWWSALALLRCISSSPMAAISALKNRLSIEEEKDIEQDLAKQIFDGNEDDLTTQDLEPSTTSIEDEKLSLLIQKASSLSHPSKDPKLKTFMAIVEKMMEDGFRPVIFCRYIATAHYVTEELKKKFKNATIESVTGELTPFERQEKVEYLGQNQNPILVATDCLSEGINLQDYFNVVIHYDLSWNPTKHEQREGRVDRFGQKEKEVRSVMLYGENNPVDGAILDVILRKAKSIKRELGIMVPMPDDEEKITQALMKSILLKKRKRHQIYQKSLFDFLDEEKEIKEFEIKWESVYEKAKKNRTIFAQKGLKPQEVLPEWQKSIQVLGSSEDVKRFISKIAIALNAPLDRKNDFYKLYIKYLPDELKELLLAQGYQDEVDIDFSFPPKPKTQYLHRTSPLVTTMADYTAENALQEKHSSWVARASVFFTNVVDKKTILVLLRLRYRLVLKKQKEHIIFCEEAISVKMEDELTLLSSDEHSLYYNAEAVKNMPKIIQERHLQQALQKIQNNKDKFDKLAHERAQVLLEDHRRIRDASKAKGTYFITPILPTDILGVVVMVPSLGD